ncbi:hypothetical protein ACF0H5_001901 [Mactra antiquata]
MNTPRSGLIRATERAIREYIQDGCENNLPLIQKLEELSYNMWVESNTDFLQHSLISDDDDNGDDGFIWDDDCMPSLTDHGVPTLNETISDDLDVSSICSSVKPCDDSDCWTGYLAGSEDEDDTTRRLKYHVTSTDDSSPESNNNGFLHHGKRSPIENQCVCSDFKRSLDVLDDTVRATLNDGQHEWVVVNSDLSEHVLSFSTEELSPPCSARSNINKGVLSLYSTRPNANIGVHSGMCKQLRTCTCESVNSSSKDFSTDVPDIEEWSVVSMEITEHVYPRTRRRLFTSEVEQTIPDFTGISLNSNSKVLSYVDSLFGQSNDWVLVRFLLQIIGFLLRKYR